MRRHAVRRSPPKKGFLAEGEHTGITIGLRVAYVLVQEEIRREGSEPR